MQRTVCIIEDDMVSQFATRYCIQQHGGEFDILVCSSAEEALLQFADLLKQNRQLPDLIFLDLVMGDMDGWEFLESLKRLSKGLRQPEIYILSAFSNSKDRAIAKAHPCVKGYFDKPLSRNVLDRILASKMI
ncbi:MAG: response regulator [Bacteroidota bacterium]